MVNKDTQKYMKIIIMRVTYNLCNLPLTIFNHPTVIYIQVITINTVQLEPLIPESFIKSLFIPVI